MSPFHAEPASPCKKSPGKLLNNSAKKQRGRLLNGDGHERKGKKPGAKRLKKGVLVIKKECILRQAPQQEEEELQDVRKAIGSPTSLRVGKQAVPRLGKALASSMPRYQKDDRSLSSPKLVGLNEERSKIIMHARR